VRVVLDTDVLVASIRSDRGASRQLILAAVEGQYDLLLSVPLVIEYEAILTRPEHLAASKLNVADVGVILDTLVAAAQPVRLSFRWRPVLADPSDDMVLETAMNGAAEILVTFNRRHSSAAAEQFRIEIATPGEVLARLRE
jgi:putative PIN family toxin of toxin-antitoxin system